MPIAFAMPFLAIAALASACAAYYGVVLARIAIARRRVPTARAGIDLAERHHPRRVCVVVPAHNEEASIGALVRSLLAQDHPALRVVFALDRCTDGTAAAIADAAGADQRVETVHIDACPDGWAGKVHAAHRGATDARGARDAELMLFTDADTEFHPSLVRAADALLAQRRLHLLSLLSTLTHDAWFERFVQPATAFELIRRFPLDRINRARNPSRFANGQFMLFSREAYERLGGHAAVREALLEDLAFARLMHRPEHAMRVGVLLADGMLRCRMYDDWRAFRAGWKRIFIEASHSKPAALARSAWRLRLVGAALPAAALLSLASALAVAAFADDTPLVLGLTAAGATGLAAFLAAAAALYDAQGAPKAAAWAYPHAAWRTASILDDAARDLRERRPIRWAGRDYLPEPKP